MTLGQVELHLRQTIRLAEVMRAERDDA